MKLKKLFLGCLVVLAVSACNNGTNNTSNVGLTDAEVKLATAADGTINSNVIAQLLVRKAVLKEISSNSNFDENDKKVVTELKENVEMEYFLNKTANSMVTVTLDEINAVYEQNKDQFPKDVDVDTVIKPQLEQAIRNQKIGMQKIGLVNSYIEKYKLNDILRKYVPEATVPADVPATNADTQATEAPATTEATTTPAN